MDVTFWPATSWVTVVVVAGCRSRMTRTCTDEELDEPELDEEDEETPETPACD